VSLHLSHLSLDLAAVTADAGGADLPRAVRDHLAGCPTCAAEVAASRAAASAEAAGPTPAWLDLIRVAPPPAPPAAPPRREGALRRLRWWLLPIPAAAALAAAALLLGPATPPADLAAGDVRETGVPAVTVYVKRGDRVDAWDGRSPVRPGDRLRVGVRGAGFAHLSVASLQPGVDPAVLYAGPAAPRGETLLPLSFLVDGGGPAEDLSVILSPEPVPPAAHARPPGAPPRRGEWTTRLHLPKEPTP
jgi:anti-sigma factor RsiW